jgi:hypothetical protein
VQQNVAQHSMSRRIGSIDIYIVLSISMIGGAKRGDSTAWIDTTTSVTLPHLKHRQLAFKHIFADHNRITTAKVSMCFIMVMS